VELALARAFTPLKMGQEQRNPRTEKGGLSTVLFWAKVVIRIFQYPVKDGGTGSGKGRVGAGQGAFDLEEQSNNTTKKNLLRERQ